MLQIVKDLLRPVLVKLGFLAPSYAEAIGPLAKVRKNLVKARDGHNRKSNAAVREMRRQQVIADAQSSCAKNCVDSIAEIDKVIK